MNQRPDHAPAPPSIGMFDSGVGGLSVLRELRRELPQARFIYVADSAHAPYGERSEAYVLERSLAIASHLIAEGAVGLVVACNTATAVAVGHLRARWPLLSIVGVEPGVKPAVAATRNGRIGVLATAATLASERFRGLLGAQAGKTTVVPRPCPGLARLIEDGDLQSPALIAAVNEHCAALRSAAVDTVVLGCTHYTFVRDAIQDAMGDGVQIVDTAQAVARHAASCFAGRLNANAHPAPEVRLQTTGSAARLEQIANRWLPFTCTVARVAGS